ncbi:MAG: CocE/NonD family hydrolase [Gemmatimonadales bacterium]|nr:CocE/NonD family hydrolase [Gemmatimonadales bacterium]
MRRFCPPYRQSTIPSRPGRALAAMAAVLLLATPALAQTQPEPLASCRAPASTSDSVTRTSRYVAMPDGVRLAVDVYLPARVGGPLPAVLVSTRYWRAAQGQPIGAMERFWISRGYAYVYADVRGTGASFGQWYYPWSPTEVNDLHHLVGWIAAQPWSNGTVGSVGTSYTGNTALLTAVGNHPALKAVIPRFMDFDAYADLTFPGGVVNEMMIRDWGAAVHAMDMNQVPRAPQGVRPVDGDSAAALLAAAIEDHRGNPRLDSSLTETRFRDEPVAGFGGATLDGASSFLYRQAIERAGTPIFAWASWLDAGTAQGALNRFMTWSNPQLLVIGPWSHGGGHHTSPFLPDSAATTPSSATQNEQAACFFDRHMKAGGSPYRGKTLIYYTLGEEVWKRADRWPLPGTSNRRLYLSGEGSLADRRPSRGTDRYEVDFEVSTGRQNRWYTQLGGSDVVYQERSSQDARMLTYTSAPLLQDLEVTGHPVITLRVASTATDGNLFAYLEDVAPDGRSTYITEGQLRLLHRKVSRDPAPYRTTYPYRSFAAQDAAPLVPGQAETVTFQLLPTSVLFRAGHRIRIAIAGADRDTFQRTPATGSATLTVHRGASFIDLPTVPR